MKNKELDTLLDTDQLSERWGIATRTLEHWRRNKQGPAFIKLGSAKRCRVLYRLKDIVAYENKHLVKTG